MWVRTPVVPGHTDSRDSIASAARFVSTFLPNVRRYDLLAFNNSCGPKYARLGMPWTLEGIGLLSTEKMDALVAAAKAEGVENVHWSGMTTQDR